VIIRSGRGRNTRVIVVKTEREKRAKAKRDAEREPVKIAPRQDATNCKKKRLRAIAVKEKGKKDIQ
jgi:hypothetical protein